MAIEIPLGLKARGPAEPTPARRPGSVRRTATIDMHWPGGLRHPTAAGRPRGLGALLPDGSAKWDHQVRPVGPLPRPDDPDGWHPITEIDGIAMRRARRIDVHVQDGRIVVDSMFQDSSTTPDGGRVAVHEYRVGATGDRRTGELLTLDADPRVLPYAECPMASLNVGRMLGTPLRELRVAVLEQLPRTEGAPTSTTRAGRGAGPRRRPDRRRLTSFRSAR